MLLLVGVLDMCFAYLAFVDILLPAFCVVYQNEPRTEAKKPCVEALGEP